MENISKLCDNDISSFRIVNVDHYMSKPIPGLDPIYSEFRGCDIKQVPVIRIFGSNLDGAKSCLHVHGVFPYLYIPYDGEKGANVDGFMHQIACSLDKAINISLGSSQAVAKHVFKISLVKGIPFYGYHSVEHQFLKIYFYNPFFVKRSAKLLQNGAIMNQTYQAHEAHVPYILNFFIDYNLYGMSFLHVPSDEIRYRRGGGRDDIHLDTNEIPCQTVSKIEIDVMARSILNRMCYQKQTSEYLNPGISSIWQDERARRNKMDASQVPRVEREVLEERFNIKPTESDLYFRSALDEKLKQIQMQQNQGTSPMNGSILQSTQTSNESMANKSKKFNLKSFMGNAVYPAESTQLSQSKYIFIDASFVENPYAKVSSPYSQRKMTSIDDSIIDEDLIISLSQNNHCVTLNDTISDLEREILDGMDKLDYGNELNEIEMDSILAPLSQSQSQSVSGQKANDDEITEIRDSNDVHDETRKFIEKFNKSVEDDSDDDLLNDFSIALESDKPIENSETKTISSEGSRQQNAQRLTPGTDDVWDSSFWNSIVLPQMDGASDCFNTPRKQILRRTRSNVHLVERSPKSSPRSTRSRYTQLDIQVVKSPKKCKKEIFPESKSRESLEAITLEQKQPVLPIRIKTEKDSPETKSKKNTKVKALNKTSPGRVTRSSVPPKLLRNSKIYANSLDNVMLVAPTRKYNKMPKVPVVNLRKMRSQEIIDLTMNPKVKDVADEYDKKNNFYPLPGPSKLNSYAKITSPVKLPTPPTLPTPPLQPQNEGGSSTDPDERIFLNVTESVPEIIDENNLDIPSTPSEYSENEDLDEGICSFYDKTIVLNSPDDHIDCSSPLFTKSQTPSDIGLFENKTTITSHDAVIITPQSLPPSYNEVRQNLAKYEIPEIPPYDIHYSDSTDVMSKKEVGLAVRKVPFKSTCEEFTSCVEDLTGINSFRQQIITKIMNIENGVQMTTNKIREFLATEKLMVIRPATKPPSKQDALDWLSHWTNSSSDRTPEKSRIQIAIEDESPVSIRREKIKMILGTGENSDDDDDDNMGSEIDLTISPLTPSHSERTPVSAIKTLSSIKSSKSLISSIHKVKSTTKARLSLTKQFNQLKKSRLKHELDVQMDDTIIECGQKTLSQISNTSDACSVESSDSINELLGFAKRAAVVHRLETMDEELNRSVSDISGPTLDNTYGFKMQLENFQTAKAESEFDHLTIISLEIFTKTRQDLQPDPEYDPIIAVFYSIQNNIPDSLKIPKSLTGIIVHDDPDERAKRGNYSVLKNSGVHVDQIIYTESEQDIFEKIIKLVEIWDPDILVGYEIEMASWGYLIDRGNIIELNMSMKLSRIPSIRIDGKGNQDDVDMEMNTDLNSELKIPGRIILDVWRLLRHEIALTSYTFENIMYHVLHRRYPVHSFRDLTRIWNRPHTRWIVLDYFIDRCYGTLELLDQLDLIGRTCELAKLFGIQFYEVLSRGSQFRVESMMLRMAKPRNFVPVSPSVQQRAHMRAPEYLPLILEPESRMYLDPLIVLDFQSLYPSMMIAYNYCFSTCLGRVEHLGHTDPFEFGASHLKISKNLLKKLLKNDLITVSPCGVAFVKSTVREGTVPRMLKEILDTRQMVKQSMKLHKNNNTLQRVLHSRQLGLKLIANVTYGYTAANFSGRMPCCEVADSVVSKGRETLERAIKMVEANEKWRCKVVYGDTDSLFVLVPGRDRKEAFRIGEEIAKAVTNDNPQPVKLKLEKVYQPSILQTKKRYVGFMYESADQTEPVYEAKGIETVRRDGCPAVAKMLEKTIRILFESKDVSLVKKYICRQFSKILSGRINFQDLIFAKEFRGVNGYKPGACVPALELTRKWQTTDKRAIPRRGERVPYIIANGPPGLPLIRLVRSPYEMLSNDGLKINSMYYINKVIVPPLNRCLLLIGVDANDWIPELPRKQILLMNNPSVASKSNGNKKSTISQYFSTNACVTDCGNQTNKGVCDQCRTDPQKTVAILCTKTAKLDRKLCAITKVCQSCCGRSNETVCWSLDCPVLYKTVRIHREHNQTEHYREILNDF